MAEHINGPGPQIIRCIDDKFFPGKKAFSFFCPGCKCGHYFTIPPWTWNENFEKPTIRASILVRVTRPITDDEADRILKGEKIDVSNTACHSFVTDGNIQFLGDCTHELAGKTVPLEPF